MKYLTTAQAFNGRIDILHSLSLPLEILRKRNLTPQSRCQPLNARMESIAIYAGGKQGSSDVELP
jgi:hypothetical protein